MKNLKFIPLVLISILICSLLITSCSNEKKQKIRLNEVVHSIFYVPQYVAIENGFFKKEGLDVELTVGNGADKSMAALVSSNADIALMGCEAGIYVYNEGKENYAISFAQLTQRAGNFLVSRTPDDNFTWDKLMGKDVIGGRPGGMPEMVLEYILKENNIEPFTDVNIITNIQFNATAGSFVGGTGDYTAEFEPTASQLEENKNGYVVASLGKASGKIPYTSYMATKSYIEENPEIIQKFTNAIYKSQLWVKSHSPEEIAKVIQPQFKETSIELLTKIITRYKSQDTWKYDPVCDQEGFELLQDVLNSAGELKQRVDFNILNDNTFANKTIK